MSTPYGPATSLVNYVRSKPQQALDAVAHPINTLESLLGIPLQAPDPHQQYVDQVNQGMQADRVQEANRGFQQQAQPRVRIRMPQK